MTSSSSHHNRPQDRVQRLCLQILPIAVAAACLWMARPQDVATSSRHHPNVAVSQPASPAGLSPSAFGDAILTSLPVSSPRLITRPIEEIRPGMRVLASNPEQSEDSQQPSFQNALDWRLVKYRMAKPDGSWLHIEQLESAADLTDLVPQMHVELSYPELAIEGPAEVISIQACPAIESGSGEVVTATFHHTAANVINLHIAGEPAPIGTTSNHPFWSEDRFDWVQAGELHPGEHLRLIDGTLTTVDAITRNPETQPVYNLTVNALHTYHVGESGVLVHNTKNYSLPGLKKITLDIDHIMSGHTAGGSRVSPLKDLFPTWMNQRRITATVKDAYRDAKLLQTQGDRLLVRGTSNGLTIEMWVNRVTNVIETAYPVR